jgi:Protein of unknown function (DUF3095)
MEPMPRSETAHFVQSLGPAVNFSAAFDEFAYRAVPDSWFVATTDVVRSREAIANGRYKEVNMAGVAMIAALMNALGNRDIPYIFSGDGAAVAFAPQEKDIVADTLGKVTTFVGEEFGLELRAAIVPVAHLRESGFDVRIEAIRLSDSANSFAFTGGGVTEAERLMKEGRYLLEKAPVGSRPDLSGLSCRWTPIVVDGAKIVTMIVEAGHEVSTSEFADLVVKMLDRFGLTSGTGNPMPTEGPGVSWPVQGIDLEARAARQQGSLWLTRVRLYFDTLLAWAVLKFNLSLNGFDPERYRRYTALNTDFRKVQDGLRMTLALSEDERSHLLGYLEELRRLKKIRYGLCVQDQAVITCYVPSVMEDNHIHFLDGAGGGYAGAASAMQD